jgi:hypothetical protein
MKVQHRQEILVIKLAFLNRVWEKYILIWIVETFPELNKFLHITKYLQVPCIINLFVLSQINF